jgi:divalent metal cation (Fe/Co/Zn/Cd) transporter
MLRRRVLILEWSTVAWNAGEFFVTVGLGVAARSLALVAFGFDSLVEVFASLVVIWHAGDADDSPERSRRALRLVAVAFATLAAVLTVGAGRVLGTGHRAAESPWGIAYLALAATVMFGLAVAKLRTADENGSRPLAAEARLTLLDGMLASGILAALALNASLGWWWADPVATLAVAAACIGEAWENWRHPAPAG